MIKHDEGQSRFVAEIEGRESSVSYSRSAGVLDIQHTFVDPQDRGKQVAEKLTLAALNYAKAHRLKVIPSCSYTARFIERHSEWRELLK